MSGDALSLSLLSLSCARTGKTLVVRVSEQWGVHSREPVAFAFRVEMLMYCVLYVPAAGYWASSKKLGSLSSLLAVLFPGIQKMLRDLAIRDASDLLRKKRYFDTYLFSDIFRYFYFDILINSVPHTAEHGMTSLFSLYQSHSL